ncbi:hypothetical protein BT69DRAFT_1279507 [Atractiella rhizophila]|nr:hypothetical protein BT69DRAFT_1279507 [Atractiella rhizophila]
MYRFGVGGLKDVACFIHDVENSSLLQQDDHRSSWLVGTSVPRSRSSILLASYTRP